MKLQDLFEERKLPKLTKSALEALPEPNARNIKDRYRVGSVAFDNVSGMGAVPNNQEVDYLGFAIEMTPAMFLKFAAHGNRSETAEQIAGLIKEGVPLGAPFLSITFNFKEFEQGEPLLVEVVGHEGRARMNAIHIVEGNVKVPVHFFLKNSLRAHHLNEKFFVALRDIGMVPERLSTKPFKVETGRIFWMGKTL